MLNEKVGVLSSGLDLRRASKSLVLTARTMLQMSEGTCLRTPLMLDGPSGWTKRLLLRSTRRLKALMKSAPMMGLLTSAIWKRQLYRTPLTLSVIWRVPNDLIREPLAATRARLGGR